MRYFRLVLLATILLATSLAFAVAPVTARAGKYTVALSSQPAPPVVGDNVLVIRVTDGDKPLTGAGIHVHSDMSGMSMPADATATPGAQDGTYGATVKLSMAGTWTVDIAVQQMAGMAMAGDGVAHFRIDTGTGIRAQGGGVAIPWSGVLVVVLCGVVLITVIGYRRLPVHQRGYLVGVVTLLVVLAGTIAVVRKYRDPKTSTVIAAATMDMSAQAAPGTAAVATEAVALAPFQSCASYTGTVVPEQEEAVFPRVTGRLVFMPYYPGDRVTAGQVVARLDTRELAAKEQAAALGSAAANQGIDAANADIAAARAGQGKAQRARQQAEAQLTEARAAVRSAESAVQSAQSGIEQANEAVLQAESDVETAQADVVYYQADLARKQTLFAQGAIAKDELDRVLDQQVTAEAKLKQVEAGVRVAQVGVARARQELARAQADRDGANGRVAETQASVLAAEADMQTAQATVSGATAKAGMASASAGQARAQLAEASTITGYTEIRASVGGVVTAREVAPGTLVQPGTSLLTIAKTDVVRLQVNVSEADLAQVAVGQTLVAHTLNAPDAPIIARISAIFPTQDPTARTAIVEARVPNADGRLRAGAYLSVDLLLGNARPALSVPSVALLTRDGQSTVFVVASDGLRATARRATVSTGRVSNERTEILRGVQAGEQIITSGLADLHDGDAITVLRQRAAPSAPADTGAALPTPPRAERAGMTNPLRDDMRPAPSVAHARTVAPKAGHPTKIAKLWYHCPMHRDMVSDKPGKCPICGMAYVPFKKQ